MRLLLPKYFFAGVFSCLNWRGFDRRSMCTISAVKLGVDHGIDATVQYARYNYLIPFHHGKIRIFVATRNSFSCWSRQTWRGSLSAKTILEMSFD